MVRVELLALVGGLLLCVACIAWGAIVLLTGKAPRREVARLGSVRIYACYCFVFAAALGLLSVAIVADGLFSLAAFICSMGVLLGLSLYYFRRRYPDRQG